MPRLPPDWTARRKCPAHPHLDAPFGLMKTVDGEAVTVWGCSLCFAAAREAAVKAGVKSAEMIPGLTNGTDDLLSRLQKR